MAMPKRLAAAGRERRIHPHELVEESLWRIEQAKSRGRAVQRSCAGTESART